MVLRLIAFGPRFFQSKWNLFDFIVVMMSIYELLQDESQSMSAFRLLRLIRALRILRMLRLIRKVESLRKIVRALSHSTGSILWITALLLLIMFMFGVLGTSLFKESLPDYFGDLGKAMFTLFQIMTMESWATLLARPAMETEPVAAIIFFVSFIILSSFIMLGVFTAVLVENISVVYSSQNSQGLEQMLKRTITKVNNATYISKQCKGGNSQPSQPAPQSQQGMQMLNAVAAMSMSGSAAMSEASQAVDGSCPPTVGGRRSSEPCRNRVHLPPAVGKTKVTPQPAWLDSQMAGKQGQAGTPPSAPPEPQPPSNSSPPPASWKAPAGSMPPPCWDIAAIGTISSYGGTVPCAVPGAAAASAAAASTGASGGAGIAGGTGTAGGSCAEHRGGQGAAGLHDKLDRLLDLFQISQAANERWQQEVGCSLQQLSLRLDQLELQQAGYNARGSHAQPLGLVEPEPDCPHKQVQQVPSASSCTVNAISHIDQDLPHINATSVGGNGAMQPSNNDCNKSATQQ